MNKEQKKQSQEQLSLERILELNEVFSILEGVQGLEFDTNIKISNFINGIEGVIKTFSKIKDKKFKEIMLKDIPSDYDTKNPKYVSIDLNSGARIVVKATKYIELTEEFEKQIQSSYLVPDIQFEASEFVIEVVGDDKKKTTKSILNGVMIRKLGSFLKQE